MNATGTNLNVSSSLTVNGVNVCLSNGTNCPAGSGATPTLQQVTDQGNVTTSTIQFAGGTSTGDFLPGTDATYFLGTASFRWLGLSAVSVTSTNLSATEASFANVTSTNINTTNLTFIGGTGTSLTLTGPLTIGGLTSLQGLTFTEATGTSVTSTNLFATNGGFTNITGTNATFTQLFVTSFNPTNITWVNATGTNTTSTNLFAQNLLWTSATGTNLFAEALGFTSATGTNLFSTNIGGVNANFTNVTSTNIDTQTLDTTLFTFTNATGSSLNLTSFLSLNGIRLDAIGTNAFTSGAYLVGVFDEFTYSNGTTVQAVLNDLDLAIDAVSSSAAAANALTLHDVTENGATTTNAIQFAGGTSTGDFLPGTDATYFLGTASFRWLGLSAVSVTSTNLSATEASFANVTSTNLFANNLIFGGATGTTLSLGQLSVTGTSNLQGVTFTSATGASMTVTSVTTTNLSATDANLTNVTSTNIFGTNAAFTNTTTTNLYASLFSSASGTITNFNTNDFFFISGTGTNLYVVNLEGTNALFESATTTNLFSTNAVFTSATTTNFFATYGNVTNITGTNATFTNLSVGSFNPTNITWVNATGTNTTSTNLFAQNLLFGGATGTSLDLTTLTVAGETSLQALTFTNATGGSVTSTNLFAANIGGTNLIVANATSTNLFSTNGVFTNVTSTNIDTTTLDTVLLAFTTGTGVDLTLTGVLNGATGTFSYLSSASGTITNFNTVSMFFNGATGTNLFATNLSGTNLIASNGNITTLLSSSGTIDTFTFVNATGTNLNVSSSLTVNGVNVCLSNGTNCPAGSGATPTLQQVTDQGNVTTSTIQFAGGTSTGDFLPGTDATYFLGTASFRWLGLSAVSVTSTNLSATEASFANVTSTNLFTTNAAWTNATGTNVFVTNAAFTNATATNVFATNGIFTNSTVTNIVWTNATGTNTTSTNLYVTNLLFVGATGTSLYVLNANFGNVTSTSLYVSYLLGHSATFTNLTVTGTLNIPQGSGLTSQGTILLDSADVTTSTGWLTASITATGIESIRSLQGFNGYLYAGQGDDAGDGDIQVCDPTIAGDQSLCDSASDWSVSYNNTSANAVYGLAVYNRHLYAAEGEGAGKGIIRRCSPSTTGNVLKCESGDWSVSATTTRNVIHQFVPYQGYLYAIGDSNTNGSIRVLVCNPAATGNAETCDSGDWTEVNIGASGYNRGFGLVVYLNRLYALIGDGNGDGDPFVCNPTGGGNSLLCDTTADWGLAVNLAADEFNAGAVYNGNLYLAQGNDAGEGDVIRCTPASAGNRALCDNGADFSTAIDTGIERAMALSTYAGSLWVGYEGNTAGEGQIHQFNISFASTSDPGTGFEATYAFANFNGVIYAGRGNSTGNGQIFYNRIGRTASQNLKFNAGSSTGDLWFEQQSFNTQGQGSVAEILTGVFKFSHGIITEAGAYDVAEQFPAGETGLENGDVVSINTESGNAVIRSTRSYDPRLIGIISTKPAFTLGQEDKEGYVSVALAGRVPVKFSAENGIVNIGDSLTSASTTGYAMLATGPGPIVGRALQNFVVPEGVATSSATGTVLVSVQTGNYMPTDNGAYQTLRAIGYLSVGQIDLPPVGESAIAQFQGNMDTYLQINVQNISSGTNASTDYVATNDIGNDDEWYVDLGINSSNYDNPDFSITGPNDAYLYTYGANLTIGTASGSSLIFHTAGTLAENERMRIDDAGNVTIGIIDAVEILTVAGNIYATGTAYFAGEGVNTFLGSVSATSAEFSSGLTVGGVNVCLQDGTNCPALGGSATPTLAEVTGQGATSTDAVTFYGGLTVSDLTATGATDLQSLIFTNASGTSLNLASYLSLNGIRLDAVGTTGTNSGASLVGVFDAFMFSNATSVQGVLADLDAVLQAVSTTANGLTLDAIVLNGASTTLPLQFGGGTSTGDFNPAETNTYSLGSSSTRWAQLWASEVYVGTSTWKLSQSGDGHFSISDIGGSEKLSILTNGNVGIGTANAANALELEGASASDYGIRIQNTMNGATSSAMIRLTVGGTDLGSLRAFGSGFAAYPSLSNGVYLYGEGGNNAGIATAGGDIFLRTLNDLLTGSYSFRLSGTGTNEGYIAIGSVTATERLTVAGNVSSTGIITGTVTATAIVTDAIRSLSGTTTIEAASGLTLKDQHLAEAIALAEAGETGLDASFTAKSIIGAINELKSNPVINLSWSDNGTGANGELLKIHDGTNAGTGYLMGFGGSIRKLTVAADAGPSGTNDGETFTIRLTSSTTSNTNCALTLANGQTTSTASCTDAFDANTSLSAIRNFSGLLPSSANDTVLTLYVKLNNAGVDLAEYYPTYDQSIGWGDVVAIDPDHDEHVVKAHNPADAIGIISTNPGKVLGQASVNGRLVALKGRVPVKIAPDSEPVKRGDWLRASKTHPGMAEKATEAGYTIGRAMSNWDPLPEGTEAPKDEPFRMTVMTFVQNMYFLGPDAKEDESVTVPPVLSPADIQTILAEREGDERILVQGPVYSGDLLVMSEDGKAAKAAEYGQIVGIAAESFGGSGQRKIGYAPHFVFLPPPMARFAATSSTAEAEVTVVSASEPEKNVTFNSYTVADYFSVSVQGAVEFDKPFVVLEPAKFNGDVLILKHVYQGEDAAGLATLLAGDKQVQVSFRDHYLYPPVVTVTPQNEVKGRYWISGISEEGFSIILSEKETEYDITFSWAVTAVNEPYIYISDGTYGKVSEQSQWRGTTAPALADDNVSAEADASDVIIKKGKKGITTVIPVSPSPDPVENLTPPDSATEIQTETTQAFGSETPAETDAQSEPAESEFTAPDPGA